MFLFNFYLFHLKLIKIERLKSAKFLCQLPESNFLFDTIISFRDFKYAVVLYLTLFCSVKRINNEN